MKKFALGLPLLFLTGCAAGIYQPKAPLPPATFTNNYLADLSSPTLLSSYDSLPDGPLKVARRNAILYEYIWLVDANYYTYEVGFFSGQAYVSTAADLAVMGTDAAAAITGTAATKSILAAVAGGVVGARSTYQKNFFDQITREAIVAQMRASRATTLAEIMQGMSACSAMIPCAANGITYTLEQGLLDVAAYYRDGTVISAVEAISSSTSQQAAAARQAMKSLRGVH
jgi:hypothetical protein